MRKLIYFMAVLATFSCNKSNDDNATAFTMHNLAGTYKLTGATVNGTDILNSYLKPCQKDDVYILYENGNYTIDDGFTTCNPGSGTTGIWKLNGNQMTLQTGSTMRQFTIVSFNGAELNTTTPTTQNDTTVIADVIFTKLG